MKLRFVTFAALVVLVGGNSIIFDARAQSQGDWIDVHFHLIADKGDLESFDEAARAALQIMDTERIRTLVVMSPPRPRENFDIESLADVAKKYGGENVPGVFSRSAGYEERLARPWRAQFVFGNPG